MSVVSDTSMEVESVQSKSKFVHIRPGANTETTQQEVYDVVKAGTSSCCMALTARSLRMGRRVRKDVHCMVLLTRAAEEQGT